MTKLALKRPVAVVILVIAIVVFGAVSIPAFTMQLIPALDLPMLVVTTVYPGASAQDVEDQVTKKVEDAGAALEGLKNTQSISQESASVVMFSFDYGQDLGQTYLKLKQELDNASLPSQAEAPGIVEMSFNSSVTMTLSASSDNEAGLLYTVENDLLPRLEKLSGVAQAEVTGGRREYIRVSVSPEKLKAYGLSVTDVAQAVGAARFTVPAGTVYPSGSRTTVSVEGMISSIQDLDGVPLVTPAGSTIYLRDLASVQYAQKAVETISRYDGAPNVTIEISKRQGASDLAVSQLVKKEMDQWNKGDSGVSLAVISDSSNLISSSLSSVAATLILGMLLSMVVLFLFFGDFKAGLIVGSSMPVSVLATLILMNLMNFSFNVVTLSGLVIGVGMMVDNSIVVLESMFLIKSQGRSYQEAALEGTKRVGASIIGSTITTVVVFLPLILLKGLAGQLFWQLGLTIVFSLTISLIAALTLIPLCFSRYKPAEKTDTLFQRGMAKATRGYGRLLHDVVRHRFLCILIALILFGASIFGASLLHIELMPNMRQGIVTLDVTLRPGSDAQSLDAAMNELEAVVRADRRVKHYTALGDVASASGTVTAYLTDDVKRQAGAIAQEWEGQLSGFLSGDVEVAEMTVDPISSSSSAISMAVDVLSTDCEVKLQANDLDALKEAADSAAAALRGVDGVTRVYSSLSGGGVQAKIDIDPIKAASCGVAAQQVANDIYIALSGVDAADLVLGEQEFTVTVEYPESAFPQAENLMDLSIHTPIRGEIPLGQIASVVYEERAQTINRKNGQYLATIVGKTTADMKYQAQDESKRLMNSLELPGGVTISETSMQELINEEFVSMGGAILIAVALVFMAMAIQFESARFSLIVMLCIPFSLIGVVAIMFLANTTLSMMAMMGLLLLVGIVVNDGILYVDTVDQLRAWQPMDQALVEAGKLRIRPILMTTLTTVLAMVPMALAIGDGSEFMQGMAIVIIGGLSCATLLTLLLLPAFYRATAKKDLKTVRESPEDGQQMDQ